MGLHDTQALRHLRSSGVARVGLLDSIHGKATNGIYHHVFLLLVRIIDGIGTLGVMIGGSTGWMGHVSL